MSDIQGDVVMENGKLYVAGHSGRLAAIDARLGQRLWEAEAGSTSMPWIAGDTIYVLTIENQLAALSKTDGRVRWAVDLPRFVDMEDRTDPILWTAPVLAGGKLWVASSQGKLHSFDPRTGKELGDRSVGSAVYLSPIIANRTLYILSDDGTLTAYK
jgi:outer membrane protein assembly factor BamB